MNFKIISRKDVFLFYVATHLKVKEKDESDIKTKMRGRDEGKECRTRYKDDL
jgi:hypothetical protein